MQNLLLSKAMLNVFDHKWEDAISLLRQCLDQDFDNLKVRSSISDAVVGYLNGKPPPKIEDRVFLSALDLFASYGDRNFDPVFDALEKLIIAPTLGWEDPETRDMAFCLLRILNMLPLEFELQQRFANFFFAERIADDTGLPGQVLEACLNRIPDIPDVPSPKECLIHILKIMKRIGCEDLKDGFPRVYQRVIQYVAQCDDLSRTFFSFCFDMKDPLCEHPCDYFAPFIISRVIEWAFEQPKYSELESRPKEYVEFRGLCNKKEGILQSILEKRIARYVGPSLYASESDMIKSSIKDGRLALEFCDFFQNFNDIPLLYDTDCGLSLKVKQQEVLRVIVWNKEKVQSLSRCIKRNLWRPLQDLTIIHLNNFCDGIGDPGAVSIAEALSQSQCQLRVLKLSKNRIGNVGAAALMSMLARNVHLRTIDLSCNVISHISLNGLRVCVDYIDLSWNMLSSTYCDELNANSSAPLSLKLDPQCSTEGNFAFHPAIHVGRWNQLDEDRKWTFEGTFLQNGLRANGVLQFENGSKFHGNFLDGLPKSDEDEVIDPSMYSLFAD
jgi:hypothetical protein